MGIAFARLANGEAALSCFKRAYELNESEASRDSWLMMLKLLGREEELHQETNRLLLSPELVDEIEQRLSELQEDFEKQPVYEMLDQLKDIRDEGQWDEVCPEILGWLEKQKEEYRGL
jgi:hypothetical protein